MDGIGTSSRVATLLTPTPVHARALNVRFGADCFRATRAADIADLFSKLPELTPGPPKAPPLGLASVGNDGPLDVASHHAALGLLRHTWGQCNPEPMDHPLNASIWR